MRDASRSADWASRAASDVEVMDVEPGAFWFGAYRNVNVLVWHQGATIDAVRRLDRTNPARTEAHPERLSTVHIITPSAGGPTAEARDAMNEMHHRWGSTVGCGAVVIERGGFMGVAVRSAVTGMMMLAPKHYRVKVFDAVEPSVPWVVDNHARSTGVDIESADLLAVLRFARAAGR